MVESEEFVNREQIEFFLYVILINALIWEFNETNGLFKPIIFVINNAPFYY